MRLLDLFCGRFGWSQAFAKRGWECIGIDLVETAAIPSGCTFIKTDILGLTAESVREFAPDFICASSPCEQFSVHGMKNFHPNPPFPILGIQLFEHTRAICEASGIPYLMENVRAAEKFVGNAVQHCGPFYLWGSAVPAIMPEGIKKGFNLGSGKAAKMLKLTGERAALRDYRKKMDCWHSSKSPQRIAHTAKVATIPPLLSSCVADFAESLVSSAR